MKTKELKKIAEDHKYTFIKNEFGIEVRNIHEKLVLRLSTNDTIYVGEGFCFGTKKIKSVMKALIEYSETPIEEREDEKKYEIVFEEQVLTKKDDGNFYFLWDYASTVYQRTFTQSEIDNFPRVIKGAIECGFLKKVEVEE